MADFTIRSDNVDVEQIMRQIRMRIKEKRGADYTEDEVKELASVKLEKFLNPRAVRSDLVEHYRRQHRPVPLPAPAPPPENYGFESETIYDSHRGLLRSLRRLLNPLLKLFFNPNPIIQTLHRQGKMNEFFVHQHEKSVEQISQRFMVRDELDALNFEVLNNVVLELTRATIEINNLRMRLESMNARQEFNERRSRAFEGLVAAPSGPAQAAPGAAGAPGSREPVARDGAAGTSAEGEDAEGRARRRRRRRGRRRPDGESGREGERALASGAETGGGDGPEAGPAESSGPSAPPTRPTDPGADQ